MADTPASPRRRFKIAWMILGVLTTQPLVVAALAAILTFVLKVCGAW
jgi:hypothetical protein